ncbi:hypothetical protein CHLRE_17g719750v5 [Chlamydomonas reinhardtii]|uniref:Uncharacterized protein n=1 Tax=Chlamydomonas reinhardtii TaxID=3055 RepID=A0A2K3CQ65_CHLRE|nr:uncharacterized protein CHLRE_17g719750v5 [Chlamydomonas reinhardtii]PNW70434.1 hypothetical protein CHLRE_17g719750v5 [Chlamydomonas reinhardtii]
MLLGILTSNTCTKAAMQPAWSSFLGCSAEQGASLILLAMHLAGALTNCSVHQLVVSAVELLQGLGSRCCPAWLRHAVPAWVCSGWLGCTAIEAASFVATMVANWVLLSVALLAAQLLPPFLRTG